MSFNAVAPWYRTLETIAFGNALQRCRTACLADIVGPRRVLIVGEGNGRFLGELLRQHSGIEVDCVDASDRMLTLARARVEEALGAQAKVRWLRHDITSWNPPERHYDLVVTHFVLDCFDEGTLPIVIGKLSRSATDKADWLLADFCVPAKRMARLRATVWLAVMYRFFRLIAKIKADRLIDPTPLVRGEGFVLARQHLFRGGILKSEAWRRRILATDRHG